MAVRQYIGARYVPKFFENPNNTAEWLPNTIYEPLTIVTYGLNTYTSKKTVPASVGDPSNNPDYWVATGNMNAHINSLQEQIDDMNDGDLSGSLQNQIDQLDTVVTTNTSNISNVTKKTGINKRVIVVSDSYGTIVNGVTPFTTTLQSLLGLSNDNYITYSEGRMGFNNESHSGRKVEDLFRYHENDITNKDTITDILIALGANDITSTAVTGLYDAINSCMSYLKTTYVNARIHIAFIGNCNIKYNFSTSQELYLNAVRQYQEACQHSNVHYVKGAPNIMHNERLMQNDGVHPNLNGSNTIAQAMTSAINGHDVSYNYYGKCYFTSNYFESASFVEVSINDDVVSVKFNVGRFNNAITLPSANNPVEVATINDPIIVGQPEGLQLTGIFYPFGPSDYVPVAIVISSGKVYFISTSNNSVTLPINARQAYPLTYTFNTLTT